MSNLENYMKQQAIFCEQNDSISKNLYSEYNPDFEIVTMRGIGYKVVKK